MRSTTIQLRRGTAAKAERDNPVLAAGEVGVETDTGKFKIGDGTTDWRSLAYATDISRLPNSVASAAATIGDATAIKRIDYPVSAAGISISDSQGWDYVQRVLCALPEAPTRFRFRIANAAPVSTTGAGSATFACQGIYLGAPLFQPGSRWAGEFAQEPKQIVAGGGSVPGGATAANTEYVTNWIENDGLIGAGELFGLSFGFNGTGTVIYDTVGDALWWNNNDSGTAIASQAGSAGAPSGATTNMGNRLLDIRIEYEVLTPNKVVVCVGDSITYGWSNERGYGQDTGAAPYESWPGTAALATHQHFINLGVPGSTARQWVDTGGWMWKRWAAGSTTIPDVGIISLGSNDLDVGETAADIEGYISTLISYLNGLGINEIWLGTVLPRGWINSNEANRVDLNRWLRELPQGVTRVLDFDKVLGTKQSWVCPQVQFTSGSATVQLRSPEVALGGGIQNGSMIFCDAVPDGTLVQSGGGTDTLNLTNAATTSVTTAAYVFGPALQTDVDLMPNPSQDNHPLRGGYQRMASIVTFDGF